MEKSEYINNIIRALPDNPGVYQYFDVEGKIIYVGKAKNLKKRVSSYFNKDQSENGKTQILVRKIADIKFIIVDTELDALLLENNLIKKYQPRYNVLLKDDKTYPWICIKNERFPRVFSTRNFIKDGSLYFGPYASGKLMHTVLDLIKHLFKLRNCNLNLTDENIKANKFKVCLEYHIGNCKAPCVGKESEEEYNETIADIKEIVKGNINRNSEYVGISSDYFLSLGRSAMKNEMAESYHFNSHFYGGIDFAVKRRSLLNSTYRTCGKNCW